MIGHHSLLVSAAVALGAILVLSTVTMTPVFQIKAMAVNHDEEKERLFDNKEQYSAEFLVNAFDELGPYLLVNEEDKSIYFNKNEAKSNGLSKEVIKAGSEFTQMHNEHIKIIFEESHWSDKINKTKVHKFEKFFLAVAEGRAGDMQQVAEANTSFLPGLIQYAHAQTACGGGYGSPHPCPPWVNSGILKPTQSQMASYLVQQGYHQTAGYASGYNALDYTKGCDAYGCLKPIFRTQAIIFPTGSVWSYRTQTPEPNPEVHSYIWPASWWADYVNWWHTSYC